MKFYIERSSDCYEDEDAIPEAHEVIIKRKNIRYKPHGAEVIGEFETKHLEIEVNTLDELLKLVDKYGSIIVSSAYHAKSLGNAIGENFNDYALEIYDTWRE